MNLFLLFCFFFLFHIYFLQLDINTVAAGGGSMLFFRSGLFEVGPESAGAHPGPACYKKGGPLTVTDANLVLGRLLPEYFPKIFGPNENESLDITKTLCEFKKLTHQVSHYYFIVIIIFFTLKFIQKRFL